MMILSEWIFLKWLKFDMLFFVMISFTFIQHNLTNETYFYLQVSIYKSYENSVFKPLQKVDLKEGMRIK